MMHHVNVNLSRTSISLQVECWRTRESGALSGFLRAEILNCIVISFLKDVARAFIFKRNSILYAQWLSRLFTYPHCITLPSVLSKKEKY